LVVQEIVLCFEAVLYTTS